MHYLSLKHEKSFPDRIHQRELPQTHGHYRVRSSPGGDQSQQECREALPRQSGVNLSVQTQAFLKDSLLVRRDKMNPARREIVLCPYAIGYRLGC